MRSTGIDNILEKSEKHMAADEVAQRVQRRLEWQDTSAEAAASWKAMFRRHKRHRSEREAPPYGLDTLTVSPAKLECPFAGLLSHTAYHRDAHSCSARCIVCVVVQQLPCRGSFHRLDACRDREAAGPHRQYMTSLKVNVARQITALCE